MHLISTNRQKKHTTLFCYNLVLGQLLQPCNRPVSNVTFVPCERSRQNHLVSLTVDIEKNSNYTWRRSTGDTPCVVSWKSDLTKGSWFNFCYSIVSGQYRMSHLYPVSVPAKITLFLWQWISKKTLSWRRSTGDTPCVVSWKSDLTKGSWFSFSGNESVDSKIESTRLKNWINPPL